MPFPFTLAYVCITVFSHLSSLLPSAFNPPPISEFQDGFHLENPSGNPVVHS